MRLNVTAMALAGALFWGAAIFAVASANLIWPSYGRGVLDWSASVYPGYHPGSGIGSVITGTLYALADGALAGGLFGWLYNRLARTRPGNAA
jgi:hypothetical protein